MRKFTRAAHVRMRNSLRHGRFYETRLKIIHVSRYMYNVLTLVQRQAHLIRRSISRVCKMVRQLTNEETQLVFSRFQDERNDETLPIRGMIQNYLVGNLDSGIVYADAFPYLNAIAGLHETKDYSPDSDGDYGAVYAIDEESFRSILEWLTSSRSWIKRDVHIFPQAQYLDLARKILPQDRIWTQWGPLVTLVFDKPVPVNYDDIQAHLKETNTTVSPLKPEEVHLITPYWINPVVPDAAEKDNLFRYLIKKNTVNVCVRDDTGKPIAWVFEYMTGAGAHRFTLVEHRRKQLSKVIHPLRSLDHYRNSQVPMFGLTVWDNVASQEMSKKLGARVTNAHFAWFGSYKP